MASRSGRARRGDVVVSGYEKRDTNIRGVLIFGVTLFAVIAFALFAMDRLFHYLAVREAPAPPPSPLALTREVPPEPRLQVNEPVNLKKFLQTEESTIASYGWVDRQAGIVRIPIQRAIDILAAKGLPARGDGQERKK